MDITITLTNREYKALQKVSSDNSMTPSEYTHSLVRSFLISKLQAYYQNQFNDKTLLELISIFGEPPW